ncbi:helix-turn-helix transcriptional regulator [Mucilaginibacter robiniae]|uniref:Helix-turn-helix transcriptional regulator n=1 Tax=Mucilaginibacter robiniae TaxID=2728022 RepID=A0A7L5E8M3_9SPHI|nr:AraC family transcriptional regulator [Mucilaginibacter robiniae]QJD97223.1 helix-turn-helix transcriptional regulator [Mucilaginibacter robiniae]
MLTVNVPDSLHTCSQINNEDISFVHYREASPAGRNLISFESCAISFILSGQKEFFRESASTLVQAGEGIIIPQGNAIISERRLQATEYTSLVIFFPLKIAKDFIWSSPVKLSGTTGCSSALKANNGFLPFKVTSYLSLYIKNIITLIEQKAELTYPVMLHKLQELFLVLAEMHPDTFFDLWNVAQDASEIHLRRVVESNISKGFTLTELAFLTNRSLATFKRDFEKAYGTSPGKYLLKRKMEIASHALHSGKSPAETAMETGYENISNFTAAFKKHTGYTPKEYQSINFQTEPLAI